MESDCQCYFGAPIYELKIVAVTPCQSDTQGTITQEE